MNDHKDSSLYGYRQTLQTQRKEIIKTQGLFVFKNTNNQIHLGKDFELQSRGARLIQEQSYSVQ